MSSKCTERMALKGKCFYCLVSYFLRSIIEQNGLKWKPTIPREQRGSISDCHQEKTLMTLKELFISQVVIQLPFNVPHPTSPPVHCQVLRWMMTSSSWKPCHFLVFIAATYKKKYKSKLGKLSDLFTWKE